MRERSTTPPHRPLPRPSRLLTAGCGGALALTGCLALGAPAEAALPSSTASVAVTVLGGADSALIGQVDPVAGLSVAMADTRWAAGDRLLLTLPAGYTFGQLPEVSVVGIAAAGAVYAPHVSASWVDAAAKTGVYVTFTDSAPAAAATADLDLQLVVANQQIAVPSSASPGVVRESVAAASVSADGSYPSPAVLTPFGSPAIATASHYLVSSREVKGVVVETSPQPIDGLLVYEAGAHDFADGQYTITLTGASFADPDPAGTANDAKLSTSEDEPTSTLRLGPGGIHLVSGDAHSITVDIAGTNAAGVTQPEGFTISGLRASATALGPVSAALTAVPSGATSLGSAAVRTGVGQYEAAQPAVSRLGGANRYATAAQVAAAVATPSTDTVIVTNGGAGSAGGVSIDALTASYLAGAQVHPTPILLTDASHLSPETSAGIRAALPHGGKVVVLGGTSAVSDAVADQIAALGDTVSRVQGANRYASAANSAVAGAALRPVGTYTDSAASPAVKTAIVASGTSPVDALGAGQVAAAAGLPILLTRPDGVPAETMTAISTLGIKRVLLLGGTSVVSAAAQAQLTAAGVVVTRFAGANRYQTATTFLDRMNAPRAGSDDAFAPYGLDVGLVGSDGVGYLANGTALADASVAGPLAAVTGRPLLLSTTTFDQVGDEAFGEVAALPVRTWVGIGQGAVMPDAVIGMANRYANLD